MNHRQYGADQTFTVPATIGSYAPERWTVGECVGGDRECVHDGGDDGGGVVAASVWGGGGDDAGYGLHVFGNGVVGRDGGGDVDAWGVAGGADSGEVGRDWWDGGGVRELLLVLGMSPFAIRCT